MDSFIRRLGELSLRSSRCTCGRPRSFSSTPANLKTTAVAKRRHKDPYAIAQARAKKAANLSRQSDLERQRVQAKGDPVVGRLTPFVQAFDTASPAPTGSSRSSAIRRVEGQPDATQKGPDGATHVNFSLSSQELDAALSRSLLWSGRRRDARRAYDDEESSLESLFNPDPQSKTHTTASEAMRRITSLDNSSSKDRLKVNIERCITAFGRHETDVHLPSKPAANPEYIQVLEELNGGVALPEKTPRAGPDTGSSEVQIAILTARIRNITDALNTTGRMDKMNKRNLRLLVHKRQKLLRYLERKERGGPRFRNVVDVLGIQPAAWQGEITLR